MSSIRPTSNQAFTFVNTSPNFIFLSNQRLVGEAQIQNIINSGQNTGTVVCPDGVTRNFELKRGSVRGGTSIVIEVTGDQGIPVTVATNVRR